ncbi:excalibur calcium-binding domain-containing protein [Actinomyces bowdenii]|uniref:excalibur calcium-binding domain-containing protein n=1 Tax=Actinomyces bowdenii TaxID=131109 RepID=UPI001FD1ECEA|nr:excalibur calcium-binding domain-containing protein [Actinomyces bowdenii]
MRRSAPFIATFMLGVGIGSSGAASSTDPAPQAEPSPVVTVVHEPTPVPTVVYSPTPVPTVVYTPTPVPTVIYSPVPPAQPEPEAQAPDAAAPLVGQEQQAAAEPEPEPEPESGGAYYPNCAAARAAGAAPLYAGDPGYRSGLDRDNDGIACERG